MIRLVLRVLQKVVGKREEELLVADVADRIVSLDDVSTDSKNLYEIKWKKSNISE